MQHESILPGQSSRDEPDLPEPSSYCCEEILMRVCDDNELKYPPPEPNKSACLIALPSAKGYLGKLCER
jgi:hypothetical protein